MTASEGNPTVPMTTRPSETAPSDGQPTIDLRETVRSDGNVVDLRDTTVLSTSETVLVPPQSGPPVPSPQPVELLRFGPGVPAVLADAALPAVEPAPRLPRRGRVLNAALTLVLAAVVGWLLWPSGSLRVRTVSVRATPGVVACQKSADVVATVHTNGNAGKLKYRWTRNDGVGSGTLVQSLARGQHSVDLHLTWTFHGPGSYDARAAVQLLSPGNTGATVNFRYVC